MPGLPNEFVAVLLVAGVAGIASLAGGGIALLRAPTTLFISIALGFAGGVLLGAISFEMVPEAFEAGDIGSVTVGFAAGIAVIYAFDLFIHRGRIAGERAEQRAFVERYYRRKPPRGSEVTVLAGGTSMEEVIEGLSIGIGAAIDPRLAAFIAASIALNNLSEGLSIGQLIREEAREQANAAGDRAVGRVMLWTGIIGASVFFSAILGWWLLQDLPGTVLAFLLAFGAAGMMYLTVRDLIPTAEQHHYQQSAPLAACTGFLALLVLSRVL